MHGPEWLSNPIFSSVLLSIGILFLWMALRTEKDYRRHQHDAVHSGIEISIIGKMVVDTSKGWLFFTLFIGGMALGAHFLSEYTFHLYDTTSIDSITHGLSAMGITAIVLNFSITRKRRYYFPISIGAAWIGFIIWEVYEWISLGIHGPMGFIQTDPIDMFVDLWVDTLGCLAVCFLYREFTD